MTGKKFYFGASFRNFPIVFGEKNIKNEKIYLFFLITKYSQKGFGEQMLYSFFFWHTIRVPTRTENATLSSSFQFVSAQKFHSIGSSVVTFRKSHFSCRLLTITNWLVLRQIFLYFFLHFLHLLPNTRSFCSGESWRNSRDILTQIISL